MAVSVLSHRKWKKSVYKCVKPCTHRSQQVNIFIWIEHGGLTQVDWCFLKTLVIQWLLFWLQKQSSHFGFLFKYLNNYWWFAKEFGTDIHGPWVCCPMGGCSYIAIIIYKCPSRGLGLANVCLYMIYRDLQCFSELLLHLLQWAVNLSPPFCSSVDALAETQIKQEAGRETEM